MRQPRNEPHGKELLRWKLRAGSGHSMGARAPVNLVGSDGAIRAMSSLLGTSQEAESQGKKGFFLLLPSVLPVPCMGLEESRLGIKYGPDLMAEDILLLSTPCPLSYLALWDL